MTTVSFRAVIPAVVTAVLVSACSFVGQSSDQEIFANVDLSTTVQTEPAKPPAEVEPQSRPALLVDVDEDDPTSAGEVAEQTDDTTGSISSTTGDASSPLLAARSTQATIGQRTMTTVPITRAAITAAPATDRTTTTAPTTGATTTTAAPTTERMTASAAATTQRTTTAALPTTSGGGDGFPTSNVARLSDGQTVTFESQVGPGGTPVLAWLWAPG